MWGWQYAIVPSGHRWRAICHFPFANEEQPMLREMQESPRENAASLKDTSSNLDEYRCFSANHSTEQTEKNGETGKSGNINLPPLVFDNDHIKFHKHQAEQNGPTLGFDKEHLEFHKIQGDLITINPYAGQVEKFNTTYDENIIAMTSIQLMVDGKLDTDKDGRVSKEEIEAMYREANTNDSLVNPELTKQAMVYMLANYEKIEDESNDEWFGDDDGITLDDLKDNQQRIVEGEDFKGGLEKFGEGMIDLFTIELWPLRAKTYT